MYSATFSLDFTPHLKKKCILVENCGHIFDDRKCLPNLDIAKKIRSVHETQASFHEKVYLSVVSNERMSHQPVFHSQMKIIVQLKFNLLSVLVAGRIHMLVALKSTTFPNYSTCGTGSFSKGGWNMQKLICQSVKMIFWSLVCACAVSLVRVTCTELPGVNRTVLPC